MSIKQQSCVEAMKQWREALESWKRGFSDLWQESDEQALKSIDQAIARAEHLEAAVAEQHEKHKEKNT
jgi:hypothetical protein